MQENRFQLAGYLAAKPILRYLPSSMPVACARLGQTYRFSRNDKPAEHTNWFNLVFYGDLAIVAMVLEKGTNLYVDGTFD
jgi:single-strand DNA-binding protein